MGFALPGSSTSTGYRQTADQSGWTPVNQGASLCTAKPLGRPSGPSVPLARSSGDHRSYATPPPQAHRAATPPAKPKPLVFVTVGPKDVGRVLGSSRPLRCNPDGTARKAWIGDMYDSFKEVLQGQVPSLPSDREADQSPISSSYMPPVKQRVGSASVSSGHYGKGKAPVGRTCFQCSLVWSEIDFYPEDKLCKNCRHANKVTNLRRGQTLPSQPSPLVQQQQANTQYGTYSATPNRIYRGPPGVSTNPLDGWINAAPGAEAPEKQHSIAQGHSAIFGTASELRPPPTASASGMQGPPSETADGPFVNLLASDMKTMIQESKKQTANGRKAGRRPDPYGVFWKVPKTKLSKN